MTVVKLATVKLHGTTQHDSEASEESEGMGGDKISKKQDVEESIEKGERRRIDEEKVVENEDTKETRTHMDKDNGMRCLSTPFDWATDVEEAFGFVPTFSVDHGPTAIARMPAIEHANKSLHPQPPVTSPQLAPCLYGNPITPPQPVICPQPDHIPPRPIITPPSNETAPCMNAAHSATSLAKPGADRCPKGSGELPSPLTSPQPTRATSLRINKVT